MEHVTQFFSTFDLQSRDNPTSAEVPRVALVLSTVLSLAAISLLTTCLAQRIRIVRVWSKLPLANWLILCIYMDSIFFVGLSAILAHGWGVNFSYGVCSAAILLCLICYLSTKVLIYYFLAEKVYIIYRKKTPRLKSRLYLFNCFGVLLPFCVVIILQFIYRYARFDESGTCIIGMERKSLIPLLTFDLVLNVYLTALFISPLRQLYSYQHNLNPGLRTVAIRTFISSLGTLTSSIVNLTVLTILDGEPAYICLLCCNADILANTLFLHWATTNDKSTPLPTERSGSGHNHSNARFHSAAGTELSKALYGPQAQKSIVVTKISAQNDENNPKEGSSDSRGGHGVGRERSDSIQLRAIEVRQEYTIEVVQADEEESCDTSMDDMKRDAADKGSLTSTEELVYRS